MTNEDYTHILVVSDRSGSMRGYEKGMVEALNSVFVEQSKTGKCLVDYVQFDTYIETVFQDTPAKDAKAVIEPRGGTALLDAIGQSVVTLGEKLAEQKATDRPGTVMVVVVTDGGENSSREWSADRVKDLIKRQEDLYSWDFTFLGANIDAVSTGARFGFQQDKSITYTQGNESVMAASLNSYATTTRTVGGAASSYTLDDRKANAKK